MQLNAIPRMLGCQLVKLGISRRSDIKQTWKFDCICYRCKVSILLSKKSHKLDYSRTLPSLVALYPVLSVTSARTLSSFLSSLLTTALPGSVWAVIACAQVMILGTCFTSLRLRLIPFPHVNQNNWNNFCMNYKALSMRTTTSSVTAREGLLIYMDMRRNMNMTI